MDELEDGDAHSSGATENCDIQLDQQLVHDICDKPIFNEIVDHLSSTNIPEVSNEVITKVPEFDSLKTQIDSTDSYNIPCSNNCTEDNWTEESLSESSVVETTVQNNENTKDYLDASTLNEDNEKNCFKQIVEIKNSNNELDNRIENTNQVTDCCKEYFTNQTCEKFDIACECHVKDSCDFNKIIDSSEEDSSNNEAIEGSNIPGCDEETSSFEDNNVPVITDLEQTQKEIASCVEIENVGKVKMEESSNEENSNVIYDSPTEYNENFSTEDTTNSFLNNQNLFDSNSNKAKDCVTIENVESIDSKSNNNNNDISEEAGYHSPKENIYEEIKRGGKSGLNDGESADQAIFKRGSLVDEVMNEVERVEKGHAQILQELNLDIENLIMPVTPTTNFLMENSCSLNLSPDLIQTLNNDSTFSKGQLTNLSTRTLPPLPAHSDETVPVLRSSPACRTLYQTKSAPVTSQYQQLAAPSTTGVKQWLNKLSSFREKKPKIRTYERARWRLSLRDTVEPVYMLYDDSHRVHEAPKNEPEDGIYEDIDRVNQTFTMPNSVTERQPMTSCYKDRQSASTTELTEDFSDTESIKSSGSLSVSSFKGRFLNLGRKLSRQNDEKGKEIKFKPKLGENDSKSESKLTRLFSKRKGYDLNRTKEHTVSTTTFDEEQLPKLRMSTRQKPPLLPPVPVGLSPHQIKRRYIIGTLVHSENSYIDSLKKLVNDYKKPLEESSPPILSATKVATLFYRIPEILQCHMNFCISLAACIRKWDKEEKMGDVFINAFSKTSVLDIYSDYINNFSVAVDLAKQESKRKNAFTDFLKVKQITSQDRLSLFGLMVKPVQRFPQFILLLQDLLKHTPQGHHDRMSLQLALTQMETITDILNERKRESDQGLAVKDILRHVSAKSAARSLTEGSRYLLRQDNLTQLVFNQNGQWKKSKVCRLFLLNDLLVCVTVGPNDRSEAQKSERFTFKWSVPVSEIEIQEEASPILNNMVYAMSAGYQNTTNLKPDSSNVTEEMEGVKFVYQELSDLLHDFEVMSRVMALVTTLKKDYPNMSKETVQNLSHSIQQSIQKKDDEVKWIDSCCLQFSVPLKTKTGKIQRELLIFQSKSMDTKQEWLRDVRMSQLALDENNAPGWNIPESSKRCNNKIPLFVNSIPILSSRHMTEVKCGCCHRTMSARLLGRRTQDYVWLCSTDGVNSHISVHTLRQKGLRDVYRFDMTECRISTMTSVPGIESPKSQFNLTNDTVWMGTESRRVLVFSGSDVDHYREVGTAVMSASVIQIKYHSNHVYVALGNGTVACFKRDNNNMWQMKDFQIITLSSEPVTCLLPINNTIFCGCGRKVWVIDCNTSKVVQSHVVHHDHMGSVYSMAHSGIGLWLNLRNTPLVCLYHVETFQHLQDVNISSSIRRILAEQSRPHSPRNYCVTTLTAILGLLWIGTNVGVVLSIPLPRLQGMPILGRRANMAYHANVGPVTVILELQSPPRVLQNSFDNSRLNEREKDATNRKPISYKADLNVNDDSLSHFGVAKTLPRSWKPLMTNIEDRECNVYGLYDNLINIREGTDDQIENDIRRSDPDLIPSLVSTLDRRLKLHSGRPRSLDLANLSNLVDGNDVSCISSSSEDGGSGSQSFTELPECNISMCSQIIKESPESNEAINECQIEEEEESSSVDKPNSTSVVSSGTTRGLFYKPRSQQEQPVQRSVMTLIGGRGYVDLRKSISSKEQSNSTSSTSTNAYAILWEMKV